MGIKPDHGQISIIPLVEKGDGGNFNPTVSSKGEDTTRVSYAQEARHRLKITENMSISDDVMFDAQFVSRLNLDLCERNTGSEELVKDRCPCIELTGSP